MHSKPIHHDKGDLALDTGIFQIRQGIRVICYIHRHKEGNQTVISKCEEKEFSKIITLENIQEKGMSSLEKVYVLTIYYVKHASW